MNRKVCQVSNEIGKLLVKQLAHELKNYVLYKQFANYFSIEGIVALEEYFNKRAKEEKNHHDWIFNFLSDADYAIEYPIIEKNSVTVENWLDPFVATVTREIETTQLLYAIYQQANSEMDLMTASWLYEKLIKEQIEEESVSRMATSIMETEADIFVKAEKILDLL